MQGSRIRFSPASHIGWNYYAGKGGRAIWVTPAFEKKKTARKKQTARKKKTNSTKRGPFKRLYEIAGGCGKTPEMTLQK